MKDIIYYEDYFSNKQYEEVKQDLFNNRTDDCGWKTKDDVPEEMVFETLTEIYREDWNLLAAALKEEFKSGCFILMGTNGRWYGPVECGSFIQSFQDLMRGLKHLDSLKIYEHNGHFYIEGSHHDGSDKYELKRLTNKGIQLAEKHDYAHNQQLHKTIMSYNFFSALPHFNKRFMYL